MRLPLLIALRYLRRPGDQLVSAVGFVSVLGLVIGVMALVISMALMTGYRGDLESKLLAGNAEIFVYPLTESMDDPRAVAMTIAAIEGVSSARPVAFQQAMISTEDHAAGEQVMIKGLDAGDRANLRRFIGTDDESSDLPPVGVGKYLAEKMRVGKGDAVSLTVPAAGGDSFLPRTRAFRVAKVFDTGFYEFDSGWLFVPMKEAAELTGNPQPANLIEVKLAPGADLDRTIEAVDEAVAGGFAVSDWREMNTQLFSLLAIQQLVLFIVIGLIVFVSTFNIVSMLIMTAHEKKREIGILLSMGAPRRLIRRTFVIYGTLVGAIGTAAGIILGVAVSVVITRFRLISFPPEIAEVYFIDSVPFINRPVDIAVIALFSILVSWGATLLPSMRASRLQPIDALRWE